MQCQSKWRSETKIDSKNIFVGDELHYHATKVPNTRASCGECKLSLFVLFVFLNAPSPSVIRHRSVRLLRARQGRQIMSLLCSSVSEIFPQSNDSLVSQEPVELHSGCLLTLRKTAEGRTITGQGQNQEMFGFFVAAAHSCANTNG